MAVIIAVGANTDGRREVLGLTVGPSEAEPFWTAFLCSLMGRGLRGVKLVVSDAHEGLKAAAAKVLHATWQRCRIHVLRNLLAHVGPGQRAMVAAAIRTVFTQENHEAARRQWRHVAEPRTARSAIMHKMWVKRASPRRQEAAYTESASAETGPVGTRVRASRLVLCQRFQDALRRSQDWLPLPLNRIMRR